MSALLWLLIGLAGGTVHFLLLRWNTSLYVGAGGLGRAVGAQALRMASVAVLLGIAARHGVLPLLLAALGIMIARPLVLRTIEATP
jgi:hypothetical protein